MPARDICEIYMLQTKARLVGIYAHHRLELPREHVWSSQHRVLIQSQLHSYRQHCFLFFPSEEVQRSYSSLYLHGQDADASLEPWWMVEGWAEGVGEKGVVKTVAACNATLFCFFWRIKLLTFLAGCVPSFLLSLAIEDGLNYWVFCKDQLKRKQILLNSTFSFSMLLHCPQNIFHVFRQFQFVPVKKKFSLFSASPWSTNQQGITKQNPWNTDREAWFWLVSGFILYPLRIWVLCVPRNIDPHSFQFINTPLILVV